MPYDTLEVRWFFDGALTEVAAEVEAWFGASTPFEIEKNRPSRSWPAAWRKDRYLTLPGAEDMGIKAREGRLEFKGRVDAFGPQHFGERIHGVTERWMKWSHAIGTDGAPNEESRAKITSADDAKVVLVEKRRILRRLSLDREAIFEIAAEQTTSGPAVDFELTRIRLNGSPAETHWSIAFEAFPYDPELHRPFARIVGQLLGEWPLRSLSADQSMSYPAWLSRSVAD